MTINKDNFIRIIEENQAILNKICYGYTNNAEDRRDLQQEILIQLWKAFPKYNHKSRVSTWMYRIALNTAISNFRRSKRKIPVSEFNADCYSVQEDDKNVQLDENIAALYHFIHQLNDLEKAIILLYLEDQSYKDISEIIGITETNVATKLNRIKLKLKKQLNTKLKI